MSDVILVAEIDLVSGKEEEGLAALEVLCERTHEKDSGCLLYALHRVAGDPGRVVMIEKWESSEALQAHGATDHIKAMGASTALAGPPKLTVLEATGFGDPAKGVL